MSFLSSLKDAACGDVWKRQPMSSDEDALIGPVREPACVAKFLKELAGGTWVLYRIRPLLCEEMTLVRSSVVVGQAHNKTQDYNYWLRPEPSDAQDIHKGKCYKLKDRSTMSVGPGL